LGILGVVPPPYPSVRRVPPNVAASWLRQSWPLRILRGFLGATFVYAGMQKLADPNFLHPGTPDFIGSQLQAFAQGSPIHAFLPPFGHLPALTGVGIALLEMAIGLATLLGIAPMLSAALGFAVNLVLFLSATWHVHPYFLGSDSMYAIGWAAYFAGLVEIERTVRAVPVQGSRRRRAALQDEGFGRREFLRGAVVGVGTIVLGGSASALAGTSTGNRTALPRPAPSAQPGSSPKPASSTPIVHGTPIATLDNVPVGGAVGFNDPADGTPSVLVRLSDTRVAAFSRVCTHAGCLVQYDQSSRILVCPCHGAEFDPSRQAEPIAGPAPTALHPVPVAVDPATGKVVATD